MDLVYIVGTGSKWDCNELRYSIRSMVKHLDQVDRIFISGHCPAFLQGVIHIPVDDPYKHNPARNIYEKILAACRHPKVNDHFLCCSSDYFLLTDFTASTFPYFHRGDLTEEIGRMTDSNYYRGHLKVTYDALISRELPTLNFNTHSPILYHKQLFQLATQEYDWEIKKGYVSKSLYANTLKIPGEFLKDVKFHTPKTKSAISRKLAGALMFSTNEFSINQEMKDALQAVYSDPTKWDRI